MSLDRDFDRIKLQVFRRTYAFVSACETLSTASEANLTTPATKTVTFPAGATLLTAYVIATLKASSQAAAEHNIGVTLQRDYAGGGMTDIREFTGSPPLTLSAVDAVSDTLTLTEDITAVIAASGNTITFRWQAASDNAGEVHYTSTFVLVVEYDFS